MIYIEAQFLIWTQSSQVLLVYLANHSEAPL